MELGTTVNVILAVLQIIIQIIAAFLAYKIYTYNRVSKSWLYLVVAFILMSFRRMTALLIGINLLPALDGSLSWIDRTLLPFLISVFLVIGVWALLKQFETFDIVDKKTEQKIKEFSESFIKSVKGGKK